jgi:hypothetical protein
MVRLDLELIKLLGLLLATIKLRVAGLVEEIMHLRQEGAITLGVKLETPIHILKFRDRSGRAKERGLAHRTMMLLVQGLWGLAVVLELVGWE